MADFYRFGPKGEKITEAEARRSAGVSESVNDSEDTAFVAESETHLAHIAEIERNFNEFLADLVEEESRKPLIEWKVNAAREKLKNFTLKQLCEKWILSRESNWRENPTYYAALRIERLDRTRAAMRKREE